MPAQNLFYSEENYDGITLGIIAASKGVRKILLNTIPHSEEAENLIHLNKNDSKFFGLFNQLEEYFDKKRKTFDVPLEIFGTQFQKKVWRELLKINYGTTISYKKLALRVGDINTIRAVGKANGSNPLPIIIPCHRVIGANGNLVGYGGGIDVKHKLLTLEGSLQPNLFL